MFYVARCPVAGTTKSAVHVTIRQICHRTLSRPLLEAFSERTWPRWSRK